MSLMFVYGKIPLDTAPGRANTLYYVLCFFYQFDFYLWMLEFILGFPIVFTQSVSRVSPCLWRSDFPFLYHQGFSAASGFKNTDLPLVAFFYYPLFYQHQSTHRSRL